jgi:glucose/arabinose dehydrogenase
MKFLIKTAVFLVVLAVAGVIYGYRSEIIWFFSQFPQIETVDQGVMALNLKDPLIRTVATGLVDPRDFAFLPDGALLVAEHGGTIRRVGDQGWSTSVDGVYAGGDAGLLGIAVNPKFSDNHLIYVYLSSMSDGVITNRVVRYRIEDSKLVERTTICQGIPGGTESNGGAIGFSSDGKLYVATGDAGNGSLAQDQVGLAGKILRMNDDGTAPSDNPAQNLVWASGFHDPTGLAWDSLGRLWVVDRGVTGLLGGHDEIDLVEAGKNYGWPEVADGRTQEGYEAPKASSGSLESWEPSGLVYLRPNMYFGGVRGESLYAFDTGNKDGQVTGNFQRQLGRLRAIQIGADGGIYVLTDNTDGYGLVRPQDDKIYRLDPKLLGR